MHTQRRSFCLASEFCKREIQMQFPHEQCGSATIEKLCRKNEFLPLLFFIHLFFGMFSHLAKNFLLRRWIAVERARDDGKQTQFTVLHIYLHYFISTFYFHFLNSLLSLFLFLFRSISVLSCLHSSICLCAVCSALQQSSADTTAASNHFLLCFCRSANEAIFVLDFSFFCSFSHTVFGCNFTRNHFTFSLRNLFALDDAFVYLNFGKNNKFPISFCAPHIHYTRMFTLWFMIALKFCYFRALISLSAKEQRETEKVRCSFDDDEN